jgi:outer membrane protein TolC
MRTAAKTRSRATLCALAVAAAVAGSCTVPPVCRGPESARLVQTVGARTEEFGLTPDHVLTLEEAEAIAVKNNLEYRVKLLEVRLVDEDVRIAMAQLLPRGNAVFTRTERSNEPLIFGTTGIPGSFEDKEMSRFETSVLIPIFDFGATQYAFQIAKDERAQARLTVCRARQTLVRDVRVAYAELAGSMNEVDLLRAQLEAAREELRAARALEREGLGTGADTAFVDATVAKAELDLTTAGRGVLIAQASLSRVLSLPTWTQYKIARVLDVDPTVPESKDEVKVLEHAALRSRPELYSQDLARRSAAAEVRQRFAEFFPRIGGTVDFDWSSNTKVVNPAFFTGGLVVASSLLEGGAAIARYDKAKLRVGVEAERALLVGMGILYEVDFRVLELIRAHDRIRAGETLVAAQELLLARVQAAQREGLESGANMARALADADAARRGLNRERTLLLTAWFQLEAAVGIESGIASLLPESRPESRSESMPADGGFR